MESGIWKQKRNHGNGNGNRNENRNRNGNGIREKRFQAIDLKKKNSHDKKINKQIKELITLAEETAV